MAPGTKRLPFDQESGAEDAPAPAPAFNVNQEYARRFEHNKKREELHRLDDKFKDQNADNDDSESSDEETEDEDAFLATEQVDAEISAVLNAIKNKDPRLKDKNYNWYSSLDNPETAPAPKPKEEKPVTLRDYHRINLLRTANDEDENQEANETPQTYVQEQEEIRKSIAEEVAKHAEESDDGEEFFRAKQQPVAPVVEKGIHPSRVAKVGKKEKKGKLPDPDNNPEGFLEKYASSRAWVSENTGPKWEAFDSDDEDEDERMEQIEHAFNLRFEDPEKSNEIIRTYARADRSVRRDKPTSRKTQRDVEKERKAASKKERHEERARLRRHKIEENEEKIRKVKEAAGLSGKAVAEEDLIKLLEDAWDDDKWEEAMQKRFNDTYYAEEDAAMGGISDDDINDGKKKKKPKKPKWDDNVDIKDLVPNFEEEEATPTFSLSDEEEEDGGVPINAGAEGESHQVDADDEDISDVKRLKDNKTRKRERQEAKSQARRERARLEALVDLKMDIDDPVIFKNSKTTTTTTATSNGMGFRYRETSPGSFGMTARDILLAPSDAALNEFAGLKKYATWRDEEKKRRERKSIGKKARLRLWRKEVYGDKFAMTGPTFGFEKLARAGGVDDMATLGREEEEGAEGRNRWERKRDEKKREKKKRKADGDGREGEGEKNTEKEGGGEEKEGKKKRRRRKGKNVEGVAA